MKEYLIKDNEAGQRLDKFIAKVLKEAPKSFCYKMLRKKNITLNSKKADGSEKLIKGDSVKFFFSDETFNNFAGEQKTSCHVYDFDPEIIYEDSNIILMNKPAGILSQKAEDKDISMVEYLISYLIKSNVLTEEDLLTFKPGICNRLDRNTSGLIVGGRSLSGLQLMSELIKNRTVEKYYLTIVNGVIDTRQHIEGYLYKDEKTNTVRIIDHETKDSLPICTEYEPLKNNGRLTLLKVKLVTGRTHQIRAHLASTGHAVLGDFKYGKPDINRKYGLKFQLLHSYELVMPELSGDYEYLSDRVFTAPIPDLFNKIIEQEKLQ